jgi:hypothetical protein
MSRASARKRNGRSGMVKLRGRSPIGPGSAA